MMLRRSHLGLLLLLLLVALYVVESKPKQKGTTIKPKDIKSKKISGKKNTSKKGEDEEEVNEVDVQSYQEASVQLQRKYVNRYNKLFLKYVKPLEKLKKKTDNEIKGLYAKYLKELDKWRKWYETKVKESEEPKKIVSEYKVTVSKLEEAFILDKVKLELKLAAKKSEADDMYEKKREKLQLWFEDKLHKMRKRYLSTKRSKPKEE